MSSSFSLYKKKNTKINLIIKQFKKIKCFVVEIKGNECLFYKFFKINFYKQNINFKKFL